MELYESSEDYLEKIYMLQKKFGQVRSIDIVNDLNYSKPSISVAMKKLRENGYIEMDASKNITLTPEGEKVAKRVYKRHQTLTKLFVKIGVSQQTAEKDACRVEHDLTDETFRKLEQLYKQLEGK